MCNLRKLSLSFLTALTAIGFAVPDPAAGDIAHADDVIINGGGGSLCIGLDCVDGETFGLNKLRLKEAVLRVHFEDSSTGQGFPANDWRIVINDASTSPGADYFAIDDVSGGNNQILRLDGGRLRFRSGLIVKATSAWV